MERESAAVIIFVITVYYLQVTVRENVYSNSICIWNQTHRSKSEGKGRNHFDTIKLPNFIFINVYIARNFGLLTTENKRLRWQLVQVTKNSRSMLKETTQLVLKRKVIEWLIGFAEIRKQHVDRQYNTQGRNCTYRKVISFSKWRKANKQYWTEGFRKQWADAILYASKNRWTNRQEGNLYVAE